MEIIKYPRTPHLEGSRLQPGDEDLSQLPFEALRGQYVVAEEKVDGANAAISFDDEGRMKLQSRGHFLEGGPRERHFALFKTWAACHRDALHARLGARYTMYGEWLYARHTVYYDALPHYFLEFDVLDRSSGVFLSTRARHALLRGSPVRSVEVLRAGEFASLAELTALVVQSRFKTERWRDALEAACLAQRVDVGRAVAETDGSDLMEGLYLKVEDEDRVLQRAKWIRASFLSAVAASGSHWLDRPIVPNELRPDVDLYAPEKERAP